MQLTLKQLRTLHELTQEDMAKKLGVSISTWRNWEKHLTYPDSRYIKRIMVEFDISYDEIIFLPSNTV